PPPRPPHSLPTRRSSDLPAGVAEQEIDALLDQHFHKDLGSGQTHRGTLLSPSYTCLFLSGGFSGCADGRRIQKSRPLSPVRQERSEEHTSELQSRFDLVC